MAIRRSAASRLKADPSQTYTLRKRFETEVKRRFNRLKSAILDLVKKEDAFGLTANFNPSQPRDNRGRWSSGGSVASAPNSMLSEGERSATEEEVLTLAKMLDELPPELKQHFNPDDKVLLAIGDRNVSHSPLLVLQPDSLESHGKTIVQHEVMHSLVNPAVIEANGGAEAMLQKFSEAGIPLSIHANKSRGGSAHDKMDEMLATLGGDYKAGMDLEYQVYKATSGGGRLDVEPFHGSGETSYSRSRAWTKEEATKALTLWREWMKIPSAPTVNTRWKFRTNPAKVEEFRKWLQEQAEAGLLEKSSADDPNKWWDDYILEAYRKGQLSSFDKTNPKKLGESMDFYKGTREQFLRDSFAQPETVEKVQLLASRVFTDLKGVTEAMASVMSRTLVDGLSQGQNPFTIARQLVKDVDGIGVNRARMIARTEVIRAHAEGQLDALETMGIETVGVAVEFNDSGDGRVCPRCQALSGVVLKVKEAHGIIPVHPQCRCAFLPANVGESKKGQIRTKDGIDGAFREAIMREIPKGSKRTFAEQKEKSRWGGADVKIDEKRPISVLDKGRGRGGQPPPIIPPGPKPSPVTPPTNLPPPVTVPPPKTLKERIAAPELEKMRTDFLKGVEKQKEKKTKLEELAEKHFQEFCEVSGRIGHWTTQREAFTESTYTSVLDLLRQEQAAKRKDYEKVLDQLGKLANPEKLALKKSIGLKEKHKINLVPSKSITTTNCEGHTIQTKKPSPVFKKKLKVAADWISDIIPKDPNQFEYGQLELLAHQLPDIERAFHRPGGVRHSISGVHMTVLDDVKTFIHEIGHRVEQEMKGVTAKAIEFRDMRIAESGTLPFKFKDKFPQYNYMPHEVGNEDDWVKVFGETGGPYIGKDYGTHATEVISMGLEKLYEDPVTFATKDPEYFKFIVGVLRGSI